MTTFSFARNVVDTTRMDAEAIQIKGPQREEKEKIKEADAEAIQIKGPQRDEKEKIKGADAEDQGPAEG
jgi:hypothetical protein